MRDRLTALIALLITAATIAGALHWTAIHPLPLWFDEANYVNQVMTDRAAVLHGGPVAGVKALLFNDPERPPAYRAYALPFAAVQRPTLAFLRGLALLVTLGAMVLLYLASRSALAVAIVFAMPAVWSSGAWFGTEYPLFFSVALLMWALVPRVRPIPLALAVALGLLSKATFLIIAAPVLFVALLFAWRDRQSLTKLLGGAFAGAAIAFGWWGWHLMDALRFAQSGRTFPRASMTGPLTETVPRKAYVFAIQATGPLLLLVVAILLGVLLRKHATSERRTIAIALAGSLPLLAFAFASPVFVPRHFSPALLPLAIVVALALRQASPAMRLIAGVLVLAQTIAIAATIEPVLPRVEQTDWRVLRPLAPRQRPRIRFLGGWPSLSRPEIRYAWTRSDEDADVAELWRFEQGAIDWTRVMQDALASDLVIVVPPGATVTPEDNASGVYQIDNRYNAEFIARLERTRAFALPVRLRAGATDLFVYRR